MWIRRGGVGLDGGDVIARSFLCNVSKDNNPCILQRPITCACERAGADLDARACDREVCTGVGFAVELPPTQRCGLFLLLFFFACVAKGWSCTWSRTIIHRILSKTSCCSCLIIDLQYACRSVFPISQPGKDHQTLWAPKRRKSVNKGCNLHDYTLIPPVFLSHIVPHSTIFVIGRGIIRFTNNKPKGKANSSLLSLKKGVFFLEQHRKESNKKS